jgi:hypothetical protein
MQREAGIPAVTVSIVEGVLILLALAGSSTQLRFLRHASAPAPDAA